MKFRLLCEIYLLGFLIRQLMHLNTIFIIVMLTFEDDMRW